MLGRGEWNAERKEELQEEMAGRALGKASNE